MILSDNETRVDLLNSEGISQTITKLLREKPESPITIGVHGDWGAGKSSVLEMIEAGLSNEKNVICIKFNGWRYQGFEDAKIALLESIVTELVEKRSLLTKATQEVKDIFSRIDWLKAAKKTAGAALTIFTGVPSGEIVNSIISGIESIAKNPAQLATVDNLSKIAGQAGSLLKERDSSKNIPKEISEFRKAFDNLLKKAGIEQLIVLVDDLDRCLPETAIETLEAIRLFVFTTNTAFVVAADEQMIEYAVRKHFPDLPESSGYQAYTRNYLEKLIQIPFRIPILGELETKIYVTLLLVGASVGDNSPGFVKLIEVARERLKKPWESTPLDLTTINATLGEDASKAQTAVLISDQIAPILASGTAGNPRQIKRFLNTLMLRELTAEARGFGQSISLPVMAKLMIAERFLPRLFEQIAFNAANAEDGKCDELQYIEKNVQEGDEPTPAKPKNTVSVKKQEQETEVRGKKITENPVLNEWLSSQEILMWAKIKPEMSSLDLRPYIFVAKDKKDYFSASSGLGRLSIVIEKLFRSKMTVQVLSDDLRALSNADAYIVFDTVKSRILGNHDLKTLPEGIEGLVVLVKVHPELQVNILDFLEALPTNKIGAWAVRGWEGVLVEPTARQRFDKLIETWTKVQSNTFLSTAAKSIQKIPGR